MSGTITFSFNSLSKDPNILTALTHVQEVSQTWVNRLIALHPNDNVTLKFVSINCKALFNMPSSSSSEYVYETKTATTIECNSSMSVANFLAINLFHVELYEDKAEENEQ